MASYKVQDKTGTATAASSLGMTWDNNTTAGNSIIVVTGTASASNNSVTSITDSQSNSYTQVFTNEIVGNAGDVEVWMAKNILGGTTPTITVHFSGTQTGGAIAREYYGLDTVGLLNLSDGAATGTSTTATSNTIKTTQTPQMLLGIMGTGLTGTISVGGSYQNLVSVSNGIQVALEDLYVTSTGSYTANFNDTSSVAWECGIVALNESPHGTTTSTSSTSASTFSTSSTSSSTSSTSSSVSSTSTSLSTSSTSLSTSSTSSSISSTSSSISSTSTSSTSSSTSISSTSSSISSTSYSSTSISSTSSSTSISSTSSSISSTSSSVSSTSSSVSSTSVSSTSSSSSTSTTAIPVNLLYSYGYGWSRAITIDATKIGSTDLTNYPMQFSGTFSYLATVPNGGLVRHPQGYDIGFYADAALTQKLNWETELYTPATGLVLYWVQVPTVSHTTNTVIYLAYGNSSITTDQSNKNATWDTNYKAVWHFGDGVNLSLLDSTSNGFNLTNNGLTAATAEIYGGVSSTTTSQNASAAIGSMTYAAGDIIGIETWIRRVDATLAYRPLINSGVAASTSKRTFELNFNGKGLGETNNSIAFTYRLGTDLGWDAFYHTADDVDTVSYHHYAFTYTYGTGSSAILYVDGVAVGGAWTVDGNGAAATVGIDTLYLGTSNSPPEMLAGIADELRITKGITRSPSWFLADYNNGSSPSTFSTVGTQNASPVSIFTSPQYGDVSTDDGDYFIEYGSSNIVAQFTRFYTNNTNNIIFTWKGRSTLATTSSPMLIQIYNFSTTSWETIGSETRVAADTDFQIKVTQSTNLSNYYDSINRVMFRLYQQVF